MIKILRVRAVLMKIVLCLKKIVRRRKINPSHLQLMTNEKKVRTVNDKEKGVDFMAELKMNMAKLKMDP